MPTRAEQQNTDADSSNANGLNFSIADFRKVCGSFPTGVTVITRRLPDGRPHGMTVSSFTSVSLHPPLILVCIDKKALFLDGIAPGLPFVVNVLSDEQQHLAQRFADHGNEQRFAGVRWSPGWMQVPVIEHASATFECSVRQVVDAGDHAVLISDVRGVTRLSGRPLVWCERRYHCLPAEPPAPLEASERK